MLSRKFDSHTWKVIIAFVIVYIVWGSTYLATRFSLESLPPFLMLGIRYLVAGSLMYVYMRMRGAPRPHREHLLPAATLGLLLLVFGSAGAALAVRTVPTGLVSLLVAIGPVYIVLVQWLKPGGHAPSPRVILGVLVGMAGLAMLLGPTKFATGGGVDPFGVMCVMIGAIGAATGAIYARTAKLPSSMPLAAGLEMLFASAISFVISAACGELSYLQHINVSTKSLLSLVYLIVFGSMLAFTAYGWLLKHVHVTRVTTYAYVNPVVAVFLGWALGGEVVSMQTLTGAAIILSAVALITKTGSSPQPARVRVDCGKELAAYGKGND